MNFTLNKRYDFRYDWHIADTPCTCACCDTFTVDHAMVCKRGRFIVQRHNELRDLEEDMLNLACHDVHAEPALQEIMGEAQRNERGGEERRGANTTLARRPLDSSKRVRPQAWASDWCGPYRSQN